MKTKKRVPYLPPLFDIVYIKTESGFAASGSSQSAEPMLGCSEDTAPYFSHLTSFASPYTGLDPDVRQTLEKEGGKNALNYRKIKSSIPNLNYLVYVITNNEGTFQGIDLYSTIGLFQMAYYTIFMINVDIVLSKFLNQIRLKHYFTEESGKYTLTITQEVKQKLPTFTKLMENTEKNDQQAQMGLPFLTFFDVKKEYPLLCVGFKTVDIMDTARIGKIRETLTEIASKLDDEVERAGTLQMTIQDRRNLYKIVRWSIMLMTGS